ncbi:MAG: hypothetical protein JSV66_02925, partial [Trueperaceae bacterium]
MQLHAIPFRWRHFLFGALILILTASTCNGITSDGTFSLSLDPNPITITQGSTRPVTVTISRITFPDEVDLSLSGVPSGVTYAFAPSATTGTTSTLTLTAGASVSPGTSTLTVTGTAGTTVRSATLSLRVTAPSGGDGERLQPSDLTYLGAFRFPPGGDPPTTWGWGGTAMTFYPGGDPGGPDDSFPGSLFATGNDQQQYLSEISIPV